MNIIIIIIIITLNMSIAIIIIIIIAVVNIIVIDFVIIIIILVEMYSFKIFNVTAGDNWWQKGGYQRSFNWYIFAAYVAMYSLR